MALVVVQIRSECGLIKPWNGFVIDGTIPLRDLFVKYATGQLDDQSSSYDYASKAIHCVVGRSKTGDFTKVSTSVEVGKAMSGLGNFVEFNIVSLRTPTSSISNGNYIYSTKKKSYCTCQAFFTWFFILLQVIIKLVLFFPQYLIKIDWYTYYFSQLDFYLPFCFLLLYIFCLIKRIYSASFLLANIISQ